MTVREGHGVVLFKSAIAAAATSLFLLPLATTAGLVAGITATIVAYFLARLAAARGLRLPVGLVFAGAAIGIGHLAGQWVLAVETPVAIPVSDAIFFGLGCLGLFFAVRLLSQRARVFSVLELAVVVGAVAHVFAEHRRHRIHQPRFLSDWAWEHGIDPSEILAGVGIATVILAALMLLRTQRVAKLLLTLLLLFLLAGSFWGLARDVRIESDADTNGLGLSKKEQEKQSGGGGGGGSRPNQRPTPVAVAQLHDDLDEDSGILYFRQTVESRLNVDRLAGDASGQFDRDVILQFPSGAPRVAEPAQDPAFHTPLRMSMFLLVDHAQPFGLTSSVEVRPLDNPNPKHFVAAYDVTSLILTHGLDRLIGRVSIPDDWSEEQRQHYTQIPDDPRYGALADQLVRDIDPRFQGDDVMKALAIKRYLEQEGFYTLKEKQLRGVDPAGKFLFGDMHGYCVHFAHAAVFLFRSQGIAARVAVGYAVDTSRRGAGTSILIMANEAHAWPEIHLAGVGWVTFDIYPEQSDEPPPTPVDEDLESLLGELARKDKSGGRKADPDGAGLTVPWRAIGLGIGLAVGIGMLLLYGIKIGRRLYTPTARHTYRAILDRLADIGAARRYGESRERHAQRLATLAPSFPALTRAHLAQALGGSATELGPLARATRAELARNTKLKLRLLGWVNPLGWWFTR